MHYVATTCNWLYWLHTFQPYDCLMAYGTHGGITAIVILCGLIPCVYIIHTLRYLWCINAIYVISSTFLSFIFHSGINNRINVDRLYLPCGQFVTHKLLNCITRNGTMLQCTMHISNKRQSKLLQIKLTIQINYTICKSYSHTRTHTSSKKPTNPRRYSNSPKK